MATEEKATGIRGWSRTWKIVLGIGAALSLIATAFGLWDRWSNRPGELSADLSTSTDAKEFVSFALDHSGETVGLDLSCEDDPARQTSCLIEEGVGDYQLLLWVFEGTRCFEDSNDPALPACQGGNALWIARNEGTGAVIANGPTGAGSLVIKGKFIVQDQGFGGGVFPRNIRSFRLTPVSA
jgi:hypothetical protein